MTKKKDGKGLLDSLSDLGNEVFFQDCSADAARKCEVRDFAEQAYSAKGGRGSEFGGRPMSNETIISEFLQSAYTDEKLTALLAHAEDGKLSFNSCCCLIGIPTATHALTSRTDNCPEDWAHTNTARGEDGSLADRAESAFLELGYYDSDRRAKLIPLIKAEMARREQSRSPEQVLETVASLS